MHNFDHFFVVFASGRVHPFDLSSPDEQSGAVRLSSGSWRQRRHAGRRRKVMERPLFLFFCCRERLLLRLFQTAERVRQNTAVFAKLLETGWGGVGGSLFRIIQTYSHSRSESLAPVCSFAAFSLFGLGDNLYNLSQSATISAECLLAVNENSDEIFFPHGLTTSEC